MFGVGFPAPETIVASAIVFILAISVHEFMHAWSANALGDDTAKREGRITLNPIAHFDPLGFLFGLLLIFGVAPIAWGKPVPVNPYKLRGGRRGMAVVAVAGPLSNLVMAALLPAILLAFSSFLSQTGVDSRVLRFMAVLTQMMFAWNIGLFVFNLLPIPPLDGFNILLGLVPSYWVYRLEQVRQYSMIILLLVMFLPGPNGGSLLGAILRPAQSAVANLLDPIVRFLAGLMGAG